MAQARDGEAVVAVTIRSVASKAGVSTATVSRVLQGSGSASDTTRARVIAAARELQYVSPGRPRTPASTRHEAHGLVLADLSGSYYSELVTGHQSTATDLGQGLIMVVTRRRPDASDAVRDLAKRVDGLVIGANTVPDSVAHALSRSMPVVVLTRHDVAGCDSVRVENTLSASRLTAHLFAHGRSHLVFVGDPDVSPDVAERYAGFRDAHAAADIPIRRPPSRVPLVEGAGIKVAEELLRRRVKLDGLVCGNDEIALAIMKRLQNHGVRIPDDLAIVGWDDMSAARYISPGLTTVRQPIRDLGRLAASVLNARISGGQQVGPPHVLPCQVVLRSSCGCPVLSPRPGA